MANIKVSKETWCLTDDKTKIVPENDPSAAWLLVRKGSPIAPEIAAHYKIETEDAEAFSKMPRDADDEKSGMVTKGTPPQVEQNYERMRITREVTKAVMDGVTTGENPGASKQARLIAEGIVNQQTGNTGENYQNPQNVLAISSTGNFPVNTPEASGELAESATLLQSGAKTENADANKRTKTIGAAKDKTDPETPGENAGDDTGKTSQVLAELTAEDEEKKREAANGETVTE